MIPIISVVGHSDSGKTTLLEKLIPELRSRGYRIAVVKHDVHGFDIDHEGKDSWKLKRAGAQTVIISSPGKIALIEDVKRDHGLEEIRDRFSLEVDLILAEGYKQGKQPKILVFRKAQGAKLPIRENDNILAIACDVRTDARVPQVDINDAGSLVDIIEEKVLKPEGAR